MIKVFKGKFYYNMPNLEVYVISKRLLSRTLAFARGVMQSDPTWNVKVVPLKKFLQNGFPKGLKKGDAIATWGILKLKIKMMSGIEL